MSRRAVWGAVAAVGLALSALVATAPGAAADAGDDRRAGGGVGAAAVTCSPGYACILDGLTPIYRNAGNVSGLAIAGDWVWNNGTRLPGADHIDVVTWYPGVGQRTICLHYGPQDPYGADPTMASMASWNGQVVTGWRWRGECTAAEERWH